MQREGEGRSIASGPAQAVLRAPVERDEQRDSGGKRNAQRPSVDPSAPAGRRAGRAMRRSAREMPGDFGRRPVKRDGSESNPTSRTSACGTEQNRWTDGGPIGCAQRPLPNCSFSSTGVPIDLRLSRVATTVDRKSARAHSISRGPLLERLKSARRVFDPGGTNLRRRPAPNSGDARRAPSRCPPPGGTRAPDPRGGRFSPSPTTCGRARCSRESLAGSPQRPELTLGG